MKGCHETPKGRSGFRDFVRLTSKLENPFGCLPQKVLFRELQLELSFPSYLVASLCMACVERLEGWLCLLLAFLHTGLKRRALPCALASFWFTVGTLCFRYCAVFVFHHFLMLADTLNLYFQQRSNSQHRAQPGSVVSALSLIPPLWCRWWVQSLTQTTNNPPTDANLVRHRWDQGVDN